MTEVEELQHEGIHRVGSPKRGFRWVGASKQDLDRLHDLKIRPEGGGSAEAPQTGKDVLERILRRAAEYRQHWASSAKAQQTRAANGAQERGRRIASRPVKKKRLPDRMETSAAAVDNGADSTVRMKVCVSRSMTPMRWFTQQLMKARALLLAVTMPFGARQP